MAGEFSALYRLGQKAGRGEMSRSRSLPRLSNFELAPACAPISRLGFDQFAA